MICLLAFAICAGKSSLAQNDLSKLFPDSSLQPRHVPVIATFKSSRLLLSNSTETVAKHDLVFYVDHRFGDIAGTNGGVKTLFGFDYATDINIAFDYGISNRLMIGVGRCKGSPVVTTSTLTNKTLYINSLTQLWDASLKYRLLEQTEDNHMPLSVTLFGNAVITTMAASKDTFADAYFGTWTDRLSFIGQVIIARKFNDQLSLEISPTFVRRNYVIYGDQNNLFALGLGGRYRYNAHQSVVLDYFIPMRTAASTQYFASQGVHFYNPWGLGWEIETGGHVFQILFTNATAIYENQFIPSNTTSWAKGQFRWGFNLSRTFAL